MLCIGAYGRSFVLEAPYNTGGNKQSKNLTDFSNHKHIDSPYNTIAATNCEGDPPLEIDTTVPAKRRKNNNQINVPEAKEAMNRFKMECANDVDFQNHIKKNNFLE